MLHVYSRVNNNPIFSCEDIMFMFESSPGTSLVFIIKTHITFGLPAVKSGKYKTWTPSMDQVYPMNSLFFLPPKIL